MRCKRPFSTSRRDSEPDQALAGSRCGRWCRVNPYSSNVASCTGVARALESRPEWLVMLKPCQSVSGNRVVRSFQTVVALSASDVGVGPSVFAVTRPMVSRY